MINLSGYINNQLVEGTSSTKIFSPETGEIVAKVSTMNQEQIEFAINSSSRVFSLWKNVSLDVKKFVLQRFCEQLDEHQDELADLMVKCIAKSRNDSLKEITRSIDYIKGTLEVYDECFGVPQKIDQPKQAMKGKTGFFKREPLGVVLAISPFNYPVNLSIAKIVPAILTGNVVIFKPAIQTAPIGIKLTKLLIKSGLPVGVVQCVVGSGKALGDTLIKNDKIAAINFTGSTKVGKQILAEAASEHIILEMGGLDAALVFADADLNATAHEIVKGAFSYSGQRCTAVKRVLVDESVADELTQKIIDHVQNLTIGKASESAEITALINESVVENALKAIKQATDSGAKLLTQLTRSGNLLHPVVLGDVTPNMTVANSELFAPVLPIIKVKNMEEMVKINNETSYGLQASVFTSDYQNVLKMFNELDVGTVNWNRSSSRGPDYFPFLGVKDSGVGEQGIKSALISMTRTKGLTVVDSDINEAFLEKINSRTESC